MLRPSCFRDAAACGLGDAARPHFSGRRPPSISVVIDRAIATRHATPVRQGRGVRLGLQSD